MSNEAPVIAVLGLGEAGGAIAADLVAGGAIVRGYDPAVAAPPGVVETRSEAEAVTGAVLVLSVNSASAALTALGAGIAALPEGALWADLNTASPGTKEQLDRLAAEHGARCVDVAIMAPVPGKGLRVPMLASGDGAAEVSALLGSLGASVGVLEGPPGLAASRKLLRSVFFKGLAAAVVEALEAGKAAGCEEWLRDNIIAELDAADESTVDRLVSGTRLHAVRRAAEMSAATDMLGELGVDPAVTRASRDLLVRLAESH